MEHLLIVPGVCRYTVHSTFGGRNIANVIDLLVEESGSVTRAQACEVGAGRIIDAWWDNLLPVQTNNVSVNQVTWVDLDDEDGSVGSRTATTAHTLPGIGAGSDTPLPGNVAVRINKHITASRGQRKGRMYIVGAGETTTNDAAPNQVTAASITSWQTAVGGFWADIDLSASDVVTDWVVVHTKTVTPTPPEEPYVEWDGTSEITGFSIDPTLGSQRRRLRG